MEPLKFDENGRIILPQPSEIPQNERDEAAGSYLMTFVAVVIHIILPFSNLIASLIYYFMYRKKSRFLAFHCYQSLLVQVLLSIALFIAIAWTAINFYVGYKINNLYIGFNSFFWTYITFFLILNIILSIVSLIGYKKAGKGKFYYILLFGKLTYAKFYGEKAIDFKDKANDISNNPPAGF